MKNSVSSIINKYDIFIFELNNAIVDIEKYQYLAWKKTLNLNFSFDYFCNKFHPKDFDSIRNFLSNTLNLTNYEELMVIKNNNYLEILSQSINEIKLIDGFTELLNDIIDKKKQCIIVSDTYKDNIDFFLNLFPILKKANKYYYRELFNVNKFNHEVYLQIIDKYSNQKVIYFTYYKAVINILHDKIKIIHVYEKDYFDINKEFLEYKIINTLRLLSVDMVNNANSGHPGMPLGCAPMMFVLWCKIMNLNKDKFILSNGHGVALLYSILHLLDDKCYSINDLKNFRKLHSKCPGHPEYNPDIGIEVSTGPLGQGIANGVGMAIAAKKLNLNNKIYVMCGDGCLMEGISYEACSLAGHLKLDNLIVLYDSNNITIDGNTDLTFTENIKKRFESQHWNVYEVLNGDTDINDIYNKLNTVSQPNSINGPSIIIVKTTIGYGSLKAGASSSHGSPLGEYNTNALKKYLDFQITNNENTFFIDNDVKEYFQKLKKYKKFNIINNQFYDITTDVLTSKSIKDSKALATRDISNICLNFIKSDNIIIGSADLAESTKLIINSNYISKNDFSGSYLHYGIREHAMVAIANGISCYGIVPIISTFLVFITYCLGAIRMSALSKHKVIFILTHDSVLVGEDGPTHQPVESLTILRAIPNLITIRPYNIYETINAYQYALNHDGPTAIILTRQPLNNYSSINSKEGAYIIYEPNNISQNRIELIIIATGSEVELAFETIKEITDINIRIISMPSTNLYDNSTDDYKEYILPKNIKKISLEAGSTLCWYKYADYVYGIDRFGKSGHIDEIKNYFNFNTKSFKNFIYQCYNDNFNNKKIKIR